MKLSRLALAAALAAVWAAVPLAVRAQDEDKGGDEETVEVRKRARHDDGDRDDRGDRDRDDRDGGRRGPRDMGPERRDDRHEPPDPEMKEKLDKMRDLETKAHELALSLRKGSDAEKAAAKAELRKTIGELYDAKLSLETSLLARMEKQVAEFRTKLAKKKSSREKAIESRFLRMSGEGDEWD